MLRCCNLNAPVLKVKNGGNDISEKIAIRIHQLWKEFPPNEEIEQQEKPLLVVLNRTMDIHSMLYHSWLYSTMVYDIFEPVNNKFAFRESEKAKKVESYELDF